MNKLYLEILSMVSEIVQERQERRIQMAHSLLKFIVDAAVKYERGRCEHEDSDITETDLDAAIRDEDIDRFWYTEAKKWIANDTH